MILGHGAYTFADAARLAQLRPKRIKEWFTGRPQSSLGPVFSGDYSGKTQQPLLSFLDLVDVFIAGQLRDEGISLQTLRRVYSTLQRDMASEHPFSRRELLTDGQQVFIAGLDSSGRDEVTEVLSKQKAFPKIILPFLKKLDFDASSLLATQWRIARGVVVDPERCFGKPVIAAKAIPTYVIADAVRANGGNKAAVSRWYNLTTRQVSDAVAFEKRKAA